MSAQIDSSAGAAAPRRSMARGFFAQKRWVAGSSTLIGLGAFMLMQPFSLDLFSYSFVVLLAGVIGFTIAGKLPK
ncbi:MAG TPA: hypothetical protein VFR86_28760 [Burkholderiaceae bacterium]|nr:hypothetical protein [Burkholderiaceae bacterium]